MAVAIDDLRTVVRDVLHVNGGIGQMEALHQCGVLVTGFVVGEDTDVLQAS